MKILVINGPNLNLLGTREPSVYGTETLNDLNTRLTEWAHKLDIDVESVQSNHEGVLVDQIQRIDVDGIVINPAAYSYTSRAIPDAIAAVETPVVEVHISNIKEREPWRAESLVTAVADYSIFGRGFAGYRDAMRHLVNSAAMDFETVSYGTDDDQIGDLRSGSGTLAVLIHGGFWLQQWTRDTTGALAVELSTKGVSTWNIEYRRLGSGGGWPQSPSDVLAALEHTSTLGTWDRIALVGHSAGAHMAMWAATRSPIAIDQIVALAPVVYLDRHTDPSGLTSFAATELLEGGAPSEVRPGSVPTLLVHGEGDTHVPIAHSEDLANTSGLELVRTSQGHFDLLNPSGDHWNPMLEAVIG